LQILADARPERGRAKVQEVCFACHGEQGMSVSPEYPNLAGQSGAAIYKQLSDYRTGSRANQVMMYIAKALDESTLADVAAYYAAQPKRNPDPTTLAESPRPSCAWSSWAIPAATSRPARRATGPAQAAPSRPQIGITSSCS
jgi:cytochrome c553